jgi:hypothetical protein
MEAIIDCPNCHQGTTATIPEVACLYFFKCPRCNVTMKPLAGDCCVFCSYSSVDCPSRER